MIFVAVLALWLTSFVAGDELGNDIRRSILLVIFVLVFVQAIFSQRRDRAFWGSFAAVWLLLGCGPLKNIVWIYVPSFDGVSILANWLQHNYAVNQLAAYWSIRLAISLSIAAATGCLAMLIYDNATN